MTTRLDMIAELLLQGLTRSLATAEPEPTPAPPSSLRVAPARAKHAAMLEVDGERMTIADAARRYGISVATIRARLARGVSDAEAVAPTRRTA